MARTARVAGAPGHHNADRRPRRPRRVAALLTALAAALTGATIASAGDPVPVPGQPGITAPAGLARDVNGDLWVADSGGGVCRLKEPPFAPLNGMVCPPKELQGPKSPGQMAFDPASGYFFVGDRASAGGAIWRLHLNQALNPARIDSATMMLALPAERVLGIAYNPATGDLYYSLKDAPEIWRIPDAATCWGPCVASPAGIAVAKGVLSMALDGDGRLYLADTPGVTRIDAPGSGDPQARLVPGFDKGTYDALVFDPAADGDGRVYAGTNNTSGPDWIDALRVSDGAVVSRYAEGFAAVTAIGVDTRESGERAIDVADDQSHKQVGEDTVGAGRRLTVPFERFDRPTLEDAPAFLDNARDVTFAFSSGSATTFWCSLDGEPAEECGSGLGSSVDYHDLLDGSHLFQVQSDNPANGGRTRYRFEIDTVAPVTTLGDIVVTGGDARVSFTADDVSVDFTCSLDGGAPAPCESPARYSSLGVGDHTVSVRAVDFLGNAGDAVTGGFRVLPPPPIVTPLPTWKPGPVTATLRGRTLRVVFDAPPLGNYARFTMKRGSVMVRTAPVKVRAAKRNVVRIVLSRPVAMRLQGKKAYSVTVDAGVTTRRLAWAGQGSLRILAALKAAPKR
jgi:hypothetical protein